MSASNCPADPAFVEMIFVPVESVKPPVEVVIDAGLGIRLNMSCGILFFDDERLYHIP
jgi:hypothetical protein